MDPPKIARVKKINPERFPPGFKPTIIHKRPYIVNLQRFLNTEEIKTLIRMGERRFEPSTTVVGDKMIISKDRTSKTAFVTEEGHRRRYSKPIERILRKVMYLVGCRREQIEGLMVVKYEPGQYYRRHHDYFQPEDAVIMGEAGQRIATFFCYLNTVEEGGETEFPLLDVKVKPKQGTAVFWWDVDKSGNTIPETLHQGNPPKRGTKYGLNIWIREYGW